MSDLRCLGEHTIDVDILPEEPIVLDVGCRGFAFDREILALRPKARILAMDPAPDVEDPKEEGIIFLRRAMTEKVVSHVWWQGSGDGAYIASGDDPHDPGYRWPRVNDPSSVQVPNISIHGLMEEFKKVNDSKFDVVKLDCEGSEFGILEHWPGPIATQISVEFHDFVDRGRWNDRYFENLFAGPLHDYEVKLFGLTPMGPGAHMGHWDSLLVLK
jgi:FkbM family methyltransferase